MQRMPACICVCKLSLDTKLPKGETCCCVELSPHASLLHKPQSSLTASHHNTDSLLPRPSHTTSSAGGGTHGVPVQQCRRRYKDAAAHHAAHEVQLGMHRAALLPHERQHDGDGDGPCTPAGERPHDGRTRVLADTDMQVHRPCFRRRMHA